LLSLLGKRDLNDVVDAKRADVTKKKFGIF